MSRPGIRRLPGTRRWESPAIVKLLAPGADPKTALRYKVPAGFKTSGAISLTMGLSMNMAGMALPAMDLPGMKMTFDLAVTGVTPAGDVTYDLAFTDMTTEAAPGLDPSVAAMIQGSAAAIKEIKGTATISNRGVVRSTTFDLSKMSDPNLKQALQQVSAQLEGMAMPLPEEAVGAGARWEVRQAVNAGGMATYVRTEYELVSVTGTTVQLRLKSETTAPPQQVTNPMLGRRCAGADRQTVRQQHGHHDTAPGRAGADQRNVRAPPTR